VTSVQRASLRLEARNKGIEMPPEMIPLRSPGKVAEKSSSRLRRKNGSSNATRRGRGEGRSIRFSEEIVEMSRAGEKMLERKVP